MDLNTVGLIVGSLSIVAATAGLLLTAFIFYRVKEDIRTIEKLKKRLDLSEELQRKNSTISNELVNVLYDLYSMSAGYKAIAELQNLGILVDDNLFDSLGDDFEAAEKHFAELGLFSASKDRRISVAQSLANTYGDIESYTLISEIEAGNYGEERPELSPYRKLLEERLSNLLFTAKKVRYPSDIRTDGGAF